MVLKVMKGKTMNTRTWPKIDIGAFVCLLIANIGFVLGQSAYILLLGNMLALMLLILGIAVFFREEKL